MHPAAPPPAPAPPGLLAEVLPALMVPHRQFEGSATWALVRGGISVDGGPPERTPGKPATVREVWMRYGPLMCGAAQRYGVPVEAIVACACTESRGDASAERREPGFTGYDATPHRVSIGLMQTLISTGREALGRPDLRPDDFRDPATSIDAGTAYMAKQRGSTRFDPPLMAAAYNAGSVRRDNGPANRWRLYCYPAGTGRHVDTWISWFGDAMAVAAEDGWCRGQPSVPSFSACFPETAAQEEGD